MHATCNRELTSPDTGTVSEAIAGFERLVGTELGVCYVTAGTFARRGLSSTAKTLRSLSGVRVSEY